MTNAHATAEPALHHDAASLPERLELFGVLSLFGVAAFVQFSIAIAQVMLTLAALSWLGLLIVRKERVAAPRFFWPLVAYGAATLVSAAFSTSPRISFLDSKQLVLFLLVPITYRFATEKRAAWLLTIVMSLGAASAAYGIFQYGLLHFDQLQQRPQGTLGHYMTYSGLLMLVICIAVSKLVFGRTERLWAALLMPALVFALVLTETRTAWVGVSVGVGLLLMMKDYRLIVVMPVVAALAVALAGPTATKRVASMFDRNDPTRRDRVAMMREGREMVRTHPWVGVGPNMVKELYADFRVPEAVEKVNPHLHNVPLQIAAERGLPALALWLGFVVLLLLDLRRALRGQVDRAIVAAAIGAFVAMLAAGFFEYNFGDSEFLMLLLIVITLPFAAARTTPVNAAA